MSSLRILQYREVSAILLLILVMVMIVDWLSGQLRRKFK
jgi:phosphonate transport system permease protein